MKVCIVSFSFSRGGAAIAAKNFSSLASRFSEVCEISAESCDKNNASKKDEVLFSVHFLKRLISFLPLKFMSDGNPVKHSLNFFSSRRVIKGIENQDAVCVFNFHWINNDTVSVFDIAKIPRNSIVTLHDEWLYCGAEHCPDVWSKDGRFVNGYRFFDSSVRGLNWNFVLWKIKLKAFSSRDDLVFTVPSRWMLARAKNSAVLNGKDIRLVPNPVDVATFSPLSYFDKVVFRESMGLLKSDIVICLGAVNGNRNPLKGYCQAEEALSYLWNICDKNYLDHVVLLLFGSDKDLSDIFKGFRIVNAGKIRSPERMNIIYSVSDFSLVPSLVESFGQVAAESLAAATPVVAFETSGLKDVVVDRECGYLSPCFCYKSYSKNIAFMIEKSSIERDAMGQVGREHIVKKFSPDVVERAYQSVVREVCLRNDSNRGCIND